MKTCPSNIQRFFSVVKIEKIIRKMLIFLLKTLIVGSLKNRLAEAVLTSTHNLCFGAKIRKIGIPQICYIKVGYKGGFITQTCYPDNGSFFL